MNVINRSDTNAAQTLDTSGEFTLEELKTLQVVVPARIKELVKADSQALGISASKLYVKILEDFIRKDAPKRKSIYIRRYRGSKQD